MARRGLARGVIRTYVTATSELARAGLADIVRGDARLTLAAESDAEVLLEAIEGERSGPQQHDVPTVTLVDDPRDAWANQSDEDRGPFAILGADATPQEIVAAVVAVAAGLIALPPRALASVERTGNRPPALPFASDKREHARDRLTAREIDVLGELARGVPNKTIAGRLGISEHTVKFHVASIFAKLGAASRTEAVAVGVRLGLIML